MKYCIVNKSAKEGQSSFRITQQLLQGAYYKGEKVGKKVKLRLRIPANKKEDYIVEGIIKKEKK